MSSNAVTRAATTMLLALLLAAAGGAAMLWQDGWRVYAVRTGSMTPTYPTGSAVVARPPSSGPLRVGEVITFETPGGLVTHRVHALKTSGVETKGDANRTPDPWVVAPRHVVGQVTSGLAGAGYLLVFLQQPTGIPALALLALSVVFAWMLFFGGTTAGSRGPR